VFVARKTMFGHLHDRLRRAQTRQPSEGSWEWCCRREVRQLKLAHARTCTTESYANTRGSQGFSEAITNSPDGGLTGLCCLSRSPLTDASPWRSKNRWSQGDAGDHWLLASDVPPAASTHTLPETTTMAATATLAATMAGANRRRIARACAVSVRRRC
jgi:hypothetical protein